MNIKRFLNPQSIALVGGSWTDSIIEANQKLGYSGEIYRVNPSREGYYNSVEELPESPDAAFIVVPNQKVSDVVKSLNTAGAGGVVCFSAGFSELLTEEGRQLSSDLKTAANGMPLIGPNCYGFINYVDGVSLWPEKVGSKKQDQGVAIISQSGGLCQCFIHNQRSLPISYVISIGNQEGLTFEDLIEELLQDPRVTAFGLYVEEIKDSRRFTKLAEQARSQNKPIAVLKAGSTEFSQVYAYNHTNSNTGYDDEFNLYCKANHIARCETFSVFMETLKVMSLSKPRLGNKLILAAGSAGYQLMTRDVSRYLDLDWKMIPLEKSLQLATILGPRVVISNPLDFQTAVWTQEKEFKDMLRTLFESGYDWVVLMLSYPPITENENTIAYDTPIQRLIEVSREYPNIQAAILSGLPEFWTESVRNHCINNRVIPLQGHLEGLTAISLAATS
jgi:acetyl-CoA synthetase